MRVSETGVSVRWTDDDGHPSTMYHELTGDTWVLLPYDKRLQLLDILRRLADYGNRHTAHQRADAALLAYLGDVEIRDAFKAIDKWYS